MPERSFKAEEGSSESYIYNPTEADINLRETVRVNISNLLANSNTELHTGIAISEKIVGLCGSSACRVSVQIQSRQLSEHRYPRRVDGVMFNCRDKGCIRSED